ncbi:MAG: histone deacetylase [Rhodothermales bacterium]
MRTVIAYNESHREHFSPGHVERPERLDAVMTRLEKNPTWKYLRRIDAAPATERDLLLVHASEHVRAVRDAAERGPTRLDPDTYVTPASYRAALDAAGCAVSVTRAVLDGHAARGFAAIRPPGHHATADRAMGFCLFSNASIAARWAQNEAGVDRVLIVDFDVHHGNGTQDIFYEDPRVAYVSVHQSPLYPGTGQLRECGRGAGDGTTYNVPVPSGTGDAAYERIFGSILRPLALRFRPELILLSAGYDAHWKDPLGGLRLTTSGFASIAREIASWSDVCCDGRLVALMEGGYDADALASSVAATVEVLYDPEADVADPIGPPPGSDMDVDAYLDDVAAHLGA